MKIYNIAGKLSLVTMLFKEVNSLCPYIRNAGSAESDTSVTDSRFERHRRIVLLLYWKGYLVGGFC